ncbi:MAG: MFS transporter [Nitrososphaeria archaeon]
MSLSRIAEESPWTSTHALLLASFSVSSAVEAYVYSLPYIAETWASFSPPLLALFSAWAPLWILLGGAFAGPISDALGRKRAFYLTMTMYVAGGTALILSAGPLEILASLSVLLFAAGGEYQNVLVAAHELAPRRRRSAMLFLALNFTNLGGALAALLSLMSYTDPDHQRIVLGATVVISAALLAIMRNRMPESVAWLERKGRADEAEREIRRYYGGISALSAQHERIELPGVLFRIAVGGLLGWSYTSVLSLVVLTLGPYFYPSMTDLIIFAAGISMFVSGLIGVVADRMSRKALLLASSILSLLTLTAMALTQDIWAENFILFIILLMLFSALLNVFFLSEDALKSEFWPTRRRGLYTSAVRIISLGGSIPVLVIAAGLSETEYFALAMLAMLVGVVCSVLWFRYGPETGRGASISSWDL